MSCDRIHPQTHHCGYKDCHTPCDGRHHIGQICTYSGCKGQNLRGYDFYVTQVKVCKTPRQMWSILWDVIQHGPPEVMDALAEGQRRRFGKEVSVLKKQLSDLMRQPILDFIERWRTSHVAGEL